MNSIPDEIYSNALVALEKIKNDTPLTIDFEEWFLIGDFGQEDKATEYNHKVLYLLLKQLKALIDPLIVGITYVDYPDASDKYFLFTSGYFSTLLKQIERRVYTTYTPANESHLMDILNVADVPLTRYLQKRESDKKNIEDLLESVILTLSDIESHYLTTKPDMIAIPIGETKQICDSLNEFVKAYKKKIEGDDFDIRVAIGGLQQKFDTPVLEDKPISSEAHYSKDYYFVKIKGNYYYNGILVEVPKNNEYYTIFDLLFEKLPHGGLIKYKELYKIMRPLFPRVQDAELQKKIWNTFGSSQNGFLCNAKNIKHIGGKPVFKTERGVGIQFNNQR